MKKQNKIAFLLFFIFKISLFGQYAPPSPLLKSDISIKPDSLFEVFINPVIPKIDEKYLNNCEGKILIFCEVFVGLDNKVSKIKVFPLKGFDNEIPEKDTLWELIKVKVENVSKDWVFKSFVWDTSKISNPRDIEFFNKENQTNSRRRPLGGVQHHYLLLKYDIDCLYLGSEYSSPDLIYIINISTESSE